MDVKKKLSLLMIGYNAIVIKVAWSVEITFSKELLVRIEALAWCSRALLLRIKLGFETYPVLHHMGAPDLR